MKKTLVSSLVCLSCSKQDWQLNVASDNATEIRSGSLKCLACGRIYPVHEGVLNMLDANLPEEISHEKEHAESFSYIVLDQDKKYPINRETIRKFRPLFLSLPAGDGSKLFMPGGSFDNQAGNASRFFKTLDLLNLRKGERVLEVGASFSWGSRYMARRGCDVVALDITNYLETADLYFEVDKIYYERVMSDMSRLPFADQSFDMIFSHSVIHHCKDLAKLFAEFFRVLKPGGRLVALHECSFGLLEDKSGKALQEAIHDGFNENAYTVPQWIQGVGGGGFKKVRLHFFSLIDGYVDRKMVRKAKPTTKLAIARWIQAHPFIHNLINLSTVWLRVLLRPKAWMMIASK
jgi:SAM-dependent methyltransferase/uncharacterized protein YbaR (Trm112 family)